MPADNRLDESHFWTGPRQDLVHRLVRKRLPQESLVVDAAWVPGSPLARLAGDYPTVAVPLGNKQGDRPGLAVRAEPGRLPFVDGSVAGVLLLDVLERLDDDRAPLAEAARVLRSGGLVLVAAPAGPGLWSAHDEQAGHRRRYTVDGLVARAVELGMVPERAHYFQCLLFPLFAVSRWMVRRHPGVLALERRPPPWLGRALAAVNRAEVAVTRRVPWPWGTSVILLGRKP